MSGARYEGLRRGGSAALEICVIAGLYFGAAKAGLLQQLVRGQVTPLWPPSGIAVASLLLRGPRVWPAIAIGAFLVNLSLGPSLPAVLAITAGNTLAPLCSYLLLRRAEFHNELNRLRDALALIFLGAFTGMLVSATTGSTALLVAGALHTGGFGPTWSVWWTGDAMGVLVVTPVLLALRSAHWPRNASPLRWVEGLLLLAATAGVGLVETSSTPLLFLGFPLLVWAAFRFQLAGAAPCALAVSTFAIMTAARGEGPFAGHDLLTNMITLQAFNGSAALTALMLAAVVTERNQTQREIVRTCRRLAAMAARITTGTHSAGFPDEAPTRFPDGASGMTVSRDRDGATAESPDGPRRTTGFPEENRATAGSPGRPGDTAGSPHRPSDTAGSRHGPSGATGFPEGNRATAVSPDTSSGTTGFPEGNRATTGSPHEPSDTGQSPHRLSDTPGIPHGPSHTAESHRPSNTSGFSDRPSDTPGVPGRESATARSPAPEGEAVGWPGGAHVQEEPGGQDDGTTGVPEPERRR